MDRIQEKNFGWEKRHQRVRKKVRGTAERPRLSVYRSLKNIYVQLIDDDQGKTLAAVSSLVKEGKGKQANNIATAKLLGKKLSEVAKEKKITKVVFDKAGYKYHGRIKALADAAREGGLQF